MKQTVQVALKKAYYSAHVSNIRRKESDLDTSVKSVPSAPSCSGIMIDQYLEHIKQLSQTLELYKELLDKDIEELCQVKGVIDKMDATATWIFTRK